MKKNYPIFSSVLLYTIKQLSVASFLMVVSFSADGQISLVKDINTRNNPDVDEFASYAEVNGAVYYTTSSGLFRVSEPGSPPEQLDWIVKVRSVKAFKNGLVFSSSMGDTGDELWYTDGTREGTFLLRDIVPGPGSSVPLDFTTAGGLLFFTATEPQKGREVWRTDGTAAGTIMIRDIMRGRGTSRSGNFTVFKDRLYFTANNGMNGYELWSSDGSEKGTYLIRDILRGRRSSAPSFLTVAGESLFFQARSSRGSEVWMTDGTRAGTRMAVDLRKGTGSSFPKHLTSTGTHVFFMANDGNVRNGLWKTDGSPGSTTLVRDFGSDPYSNLTQITGRAGAGGLFYYVYGDEVYSSDGTDAGTGVIYRLADYYEGASLHVKDQTVYLIQNEYPERPDAYDYYQLNLVRLDNGGAQQVAALGYGRPGRHPIFTGSASSLIYFTVPDSAGDVSLWRSDGTRAGTVVMTTGETNTASSSPSYFTPYKGKLFFATQHWSFSGFWQSDGTAEGTTEFLPSFVRELSVAGDLLYFERNADLWRTDGTKEGTIELSENSPFVSSRVNGKYIYTTYQYPMGTELWYSAGTRETTGLLKDINPVGSSDPHNLTPAGSQLFFAAFQPGYGSELWKTDGTPNGTVLVKDIMPGPNSSNVAMITAFQEKVFFVAYTVNEGYELWSSDGTAGGTVMVKDIAADDAMMSDIRSVAATDEAVYFTTEKKGGVHELWVSDGSASGTLKVTELGVQPDVRMLKAIGNTLFFMVQADWSAPTQLWKTDGTTEGTSVIAEIDGSYSFQPVVVAGDVLYFVVSWQTIWRTDGTPCGTYPIEFIDGQEPESLGSLTRFGDHIYFHAFWNPVGEELFRLSLDEKPKIPCNSGNTIARSAALVPLTEESSSDGMTTTYPNPFSGTLMVRVNSDKVSSFNASVYSMDGRLINSVVLPTNTDNQLGRELQRGVYMIRTAIPGKQEVRRIVKTD